MGKFDLKQLYAVRMVTNKGAWAELRLYRHPMQEDRFLVNTDVGTQRSQTYRHPSYAMACLLQPLTASQASAKFKAWWHGETQHAYYDVVPNSLVESIKFKSKLR